MKVILNSFLTGTLFAALALPQVPSLSTTSLSGRRNAPARWAGASTDQSTRLKAGLSVYVITVGLEFGTIELRSGSYVPIGPGLPPDVGTGLVHGAGTSLLTLAFSGNLDAIDPRTGITTVVGPTGLGDCATPASPCGPKSANVIGNLGNRVYATDFANNLYSVDPGTGAAKRIGPTGMPGITFIPFSSNPDGTLNVYAESLIGARGQLYANFGTARLDPSTGRATPVIPGALYQIDTTTGRARLIGPFETNISSMVAVDDAIYGFNAATGRVVTVNLINGETKPVSEVDAAAGVIVGATPTRPLQ